MKTDDVQREAPGRRADTAADQTGITEHASADEASNRRPYDVLKIANGGRSPAQEIVPVDPSPAELDAALAAATLAVSRANDQSSDEAAHEASNDIPAVAEVERRRRDTAFADAGTHLPTAASNDVLTDD